MLMSLFLAGGAVFGSHDAGRRASGGRVGVLDGVVAIRGFSCDRRVRSRHVFPDCVHFQGFAIDSGRVLCGPLAFILLVLLAAAISSCGGSVSAAVTLEPVNFSFGEQSGPGPQRTQNLGVTHGRHNEWGQIEQQQIQQENSAIGHFVFLCNRPGVK